MPFNLLLLPFLGGYWLLRRTHRTRFLLARLDTQRLLIWSALVAVALLVVSAIAVSMLAHVVPGVVPVWQRFSPFDHSGKAAGALLLGLFAPVVLNRLPHIRDADHWARESIRLHGQEVEHVLLRSQDHEMPVMVTLGTGKVYVGYVERSPNLEVERRYLRLIPVISGFREKDDQNVVFTSDYAYVRALADEVGSPFYGMLGKDFDIVIPLSEIKTLHLFDLSVFETFQAQRAP